MKMQTNCSCEDSSLVEWYFVEIVIKLPPFRGKGGPLFSGSKVQEVYLLPNIVAVRLLEMSVNIYQSTESDSSENFDLPQYRCQNVKPQTTLPHSLLQNECYLYPES